MAESLTTNKQREREEQMLLQNRLLTIASDSVPADLYKELMMNYLCSSKITEAKFVWQNLPAAMKADGEFQYLAKIASVLSSKQYREFYLLCHMALENGSSPEMTKHIQQLVARIMTRNVELIELAYKSISFDDLHTLFGLNAKMVEQVCVERGWQKDPGGVYVLPCRNDNIAASNSNLTKLVELVCFLER